MKKLVCMVLSFTMIISAFIFPFQAAASYVDERWQYTDGVQQERCTYRVWHEAYDRLGVSLPTTWGNGASWADNAARDGYVVDKNPSANSIACWDDGGWGHVAYVTAVDSTYVYFRQAGINPSSSYSGYWYQDTKRTPSAMNNSEFEGYIHIKDISPIYSQKPSNVKLSLEKTTFYSSEHVTYYCSGNDVSYYALSIYNNKGNIIESVKINPGEYCIRYYDPGTYTAYCEAINNCGTTFSNNITFTVKQNTLPTNVKLSLEKNTFFTDEHVTYYCSGNDVSYYVISIYNDKGNLLETVKINPGEYCIRYYSVGTYTAYCEAFNACGETFSNNVKFTVKKKCNTHSWNSGTITKAATCTTEGSKKYTCTICGETKTETIKAKGHTEVTDKAVSATCTKDGKTAGSHCSVCNVVIKKQETVKATGHSYDSGKITSTTSTTYTKTFTCSKCKNTYTKKYNKKANTLTVSGKTATVKYANLKKKNQTVALKNAIAVSKAKGTVTYAKSSGNSKITINKTSGNITVKKGLKKGTYKVKIKVTAAGTKEYKSLSKTVTVTIKVK